MKSRARILVCGMIAADPWQGGATWAVLQYVLGLLRLGHDVRLVDPMPPGSVVPAGAGLAASVNAGYFDRVMADFSLQGRAALLVSGTRETHGMSGDDLRDWARNADVLINISGLLTDEALFAPIPVRVYLDLDPAFNQLWSAVQGIDMRYAGHTHFVTIGRSLGAPECSVPTAGRDWIKTFQPVVLERWPVAGAVERDALTMIGNWRGYGSIEHGGVLYGQKAHSFREFLALPGLTTEKFLLALAIHPGETRDLAAMEARRWARVDPAEVTSTPGAYQRFIQGSKGEFGIAKSGYVVSRCGWFSDRSLCYLASGRPVLAQETGFSRHLPVGTGLLAFSRMDDLLEAIADLNRRYAEHARAARRLAEEFFDSDKVLRRLLGEVGV